MSENLDLDELRRRWVKLRPTDDLLVEVLIARVRLGENVWTFANRHRAAMDRLVVLGFVKWWKSAPVEGCILVAPSDLLREHMAGNEYRAPLLAEVVALREQVARVRAVARDHHQYRPAAFDDYDCCSECNRLSGGYVPWPCELVAALDAPKEPQQ